ICCNPACGPNYGC
nr:Chain A, Alpha-conotoxin S2 [Conus striatus]